MVSVYLGDSAVPLEADPLDEYHPARDRLFKPLARIGLVEVHQHGEPWLRVHQGRREWWVLLVPLVDPFDKRRWRFCLTTREVEYGGPHHG